MTGAEATTIVTGFTSALDGGIIAMLPVALTFVAGLSLVMYGYHFVKRAIGGTRS